MTRDTKKSYKEAVADGECEDLSATAPIWWDVIAEMWPNQYPWNPRGAVNHTTHKTGRKRGARGKIAQLRERGK